MASSSFHIVLLKCIDFLSCCRPRTCFGLSSEWKNIFASKQDLTQNGTEAFGKLIASKNTEQSFLHAETRKAVPRTTEKNEILKQVSNMKETESISGLKYLIHEEVYLPTLLSLTNKERFLFEQKHIKDLEMIEKEEVCEGKQDSLKSKESTSFSMAKAENMLADTADTEYGTHAKISAAKNVQNEWTCAICQLTMSSEAKLNCHLQGRKHKVACEALNMMKTKAAPINTGTRASSTMKNTGIRVCPQVSASKNAQKMFNCAVCQLTKLPKHNMKSHLKGKKHKAACEALSGKSQGVSKKGLL